MLESLTIDELLECFKASMAKRNKDFSLKIKEADSTLKEKDLLTRLDDIEKRVYDSLYSRQAGLIDALDLRIENLEGIIKSQDLLILYT